MFYQTGIVSFSLLPGFKTCVLSDRKCLLFASTLVRPLCFIRQELFPLRWYMGSLPVFYEAGIVSSLLVPGFTPCVLSNRNCFLFVSTWVHPLCFIRHELFPLRYYLGSPPVFYQTGIVSSSLVPWFIPCVLWNRNVSSSLVTLFIPCVLSDRNYFLFASTWGHPLCFIRQELFPLR